MSKQNKEAMTPQQKELDAKMAVYAKSETVLNKTCATIEERVDAIRQKYDEKLTTQTKERDEALLEVKRVTDGARAELFTGGAKSLKTSRGVVGYKLSKPKLVLEDGKAWSDLTDTVKELAPDYIRVKVEVARDRLYADRELPFVKRLLETIGAKVVQDEQFYVELK